MIFLSLLGIAAGIYLWTHVHPLVGLAVGIVFGSGFGWMYLFALMQPGRKRQGKALDAFLFEWRGRYPGRGRPPRELAMAYLNGLDVAWHTPSQFFDKMEAPAMGAADHERPDSVTVRGSVFGSLPSMIDHPLWGEGIMTLRSDGHYRWTTPATHLDGTRPERWSDSVGFFGAGPGQAAWMTLGGGWTFEADRSDSPALGTWLRDHHSSTETSTAT